jgi:trehalose/maltose hydrolase-like predicted phosphorylase
MTWEKMCFLTGAAGPIQACIFGLAGAQMDYNNPSTELVFKPCLPKQWKSIKLTEVQWRGKTFDTLITRSGAKYIPLH